MIFVSVGTHEDPFDRLVGAADDIARRTGERVVVQRGTSRAAIVACEVFDYCSPDQLAAWMRLARVVVVHAGPASIWLAEDCGHLPIVVPRDPKHGEHVDGHQLAFAAQLGSHAVVTDPAGLGTAVAGHQDRSDGAAPARSAERTAAFAARLSALCDELAAGRGRAP